MVQRRRAVGVLVVSLSVLVAATVVGTPSVPTQGGVAEHVSTFSAGLRVAFASNNVYVAGASVALTDWSNETASGYNLDQLDGLLIKYNAQSLDESWNRTYDYGGAEQFQDVVIDASGAIFTTGYQDDGSIDHLVVAKFDSNGDEVWHTILSAESQGGGIALDSQGNPWVAGRGGQGYYVAKFNKDSGVLLSSCSPAFSGYDFLQVATGVKFLSGGDLVFSGIEVKEIPQGLETRSAVTRMASDCTVAWHVTTTDPNGVGHQSWSVAVGPADKVYVAGSRGSLLTGSEHWVFTQSLTADGSVRWGNEYRDENDLLHLDYQGIGISVDSNGTSYTTGFDGRTGMWVWIGPVPKLGYYNFTVMSVHSNLLTVKYLDDGTRDWAVTFSQGEFDYFGQGNALDGSSRLFVTGAKVKTPSLLNQQEYVRSITVKYIDL